MPRKEWSDADERMYRHVRRSELDRGRSESRAEEIAARTVNSHRREKGRTASKQTMGTGNPHTRLESRTVDELRNRSRELEIAGRSSMKKAELVHAIRERS